MNEIRRLINLNDWTKILKLIKQNKINILSDINEGGNIVHIAAINNKDRVIEYVIKKRSTVLRKANKDGETVGHILASYGYDRNLKKVIRKDPSIVNLLNDRHETVMHKIARRDDDEIFRWILENGEIELDAIDEKGETILTITIKRTKKKNDRYDKRIIKILEQGANINIPYENTPLCVAIKTNKDHIVERLIKLGAEIDKKNSSYMTPLLIAISEKKYKIIETLLKKGASPNYSGAEGDMNPIGMALKMGDSMMIEILLRNGADIKKYNRFMETPLHIALKTEKRVLPSHIAKLIYYGDINSKDVNGETPLHILLRKHRWKDYTMILREKELDIFVRDNMNKMPISYINNRELAEFMEEVAKGYMKRMSMDKKENMNRCEKIKKKECIRKIKQQILKSREYPMKEISTMTELVKGEEVNSVKFNSDTLHGVIYTLIILEKYKNISVPYQNYIHDKVMNDKMRQNENYVVVTGEEVVITDLLKIYTDYFYELMPYIILWRSEDQYKIDEEIEYYLQRSMDNEKIEIIFMKLTLIASTQGTHANIIIFDKRTGILERFEPYGEVPYLETNKLDMILEKKLGRIFKKYLKKKGKVFKYNRPSSEVSFQILSSDTENIVRKLGDPKGFCLAWTLWYLEMRIKNPEVEPKQLIKRAKDAITRTGKGVYAYIDFIRNYANELDNGKNKFLKETGIKDIDIYNIVLKKSDQKKLIEAMTYKFKKLMKDRI